MKGKRQAVEGQGSLFDRAEARTGGKEKDRIDRGKKPGPAPSRWRMPEVQGCTVAEIRLRWAKRLTPAQVGRVEAELGRLPQLLTKLNFGAVAVERTFVRRRRG